MTLHSGTYHPGAAKDDIDALNTVTHKSVVDAINELAHTQALTERVCAVAIGLQGAAPWAGPALPTGAVITGIQVHVSAAYPASSILSLGDHSGSNGALAATSISNGTGVTLTATGDVSLPKAVTPVGALSVSVAGGDGSTGAAVVFFRYVIGENDAI